MDEVIGYVTVAEADKYVEEHFTSANPIRRAWDFTDNLDKKVLLRNSYRAIEALPFRGHKTSTTQPGAFPRYPSHEVPIQIKEAQIVNAVVLIDPDTKEDVDYYDKLRTYGVKSYHIGNLTETLVTPTENSEVSSHVGIYSQEAVRLMSPWLKGGFNIS